MIRLTVSLLSALLLAASSAGATQQGQTALRSWKVMDACTRQAQTAYPEFSAEANVPEVLKVAADKTARAMPALPAAALAARVPRTVTAAPVSGKSTLR